MLYPQDYDNFESDSQSDDQFRGRKLDETFHSLKLTMRDRSNDDFQFIFPPQEVSNLGLDSSHEINADPECSSLSSVSENKLQSSFCSQSSVGSIGQLVKKLETTSKLGSTNKKKSKPSDSLDIEKNHLALLESSIDIEECLRNSMASSISTVFEGQANRKRLPVWESTPIDVRKSDFYQRNRASRPARSKGLSTQDLGIASKDSDNDDAKSVESNNSCNEAPNINLITQQLQELLAVNDNPLLLPLIIQLLNGQSVNASSDEQLQNLAGRMKLSNGQKVPSTDRTEPDSAKLEDARPERSSSSESSSSRFCLPNLSRRSRTPDDPKESKPLCEGIKNHVNVKRGMVLEDGTEKDEFEKKFCSPHNFMGEVQNFGKFYNTTDSEVKPIEEKFRYDQIMEIKKGASTHSLAPSSSSRATSSLPASMASPLLIQHKSMSSKRTSRPKPSSRSGSSLPSSSSPSVLTQSLNALYVKNKSFKQQLSDVFKFLINLDGRGKTEEVDRHGDDVTITLVDDEEDPFEDVNKDEISWLLKSVSRTNAGQVVAHQTLDGHRVPFVIQTNSVMKDLPPVTTKEKLQTVKSCDDDDLLSVSVDVIPSEVCEVSKVREKKSEPTYSEIENPVTSSTPSSDYCSINQSTCEENHKPTSGIYSKRSKDAREFIVQTRDECVQVGSGDLREHEEQIFSSPRHMRKSFESPSIHLKKKVEPSGRFKKPSNWLFNRDERACGAFTPEELSLECPLTPSSSGKSSLSTVPKKIDSNGNVIVSAPNQWTIMFEDDKFKGYSPNDIQKDLQMRKHKLRESLEGHQKPRVSKNRATSSLGKPKVLGNAADRQNFAKKDAASKGLVNTPKATQGVKQAQLSNGLKVRSSTLESSKGRTVVKHQNGKIQRKVSMPTT